MITCYCDGGSEALKILEYAKYYKEYNFILAHMLGYESLAKQNHLLPSNLFLEMSITIEDFYSQKGKDISTAMRKIGLRHFLFGSDNTDPNLTYDNRSYAPEGGQHFHPSPLISLMKSDFTKQELKTLLWDNGEAFWNHITQ